MREYTNKLLEILDERSDNYELIVALVSCMSERDVKEFYETYYFDLINFEETSE